MWDRRSFGKMCPEGGGREMVLMQGRSCVNSERLLVVRSRLSRHPHFKFLLLHSLFNVAYILPSHFLNSLPLCQTNLILSGLSPISLLSHVPDILMTSPESIPKKQMTKPLHFFPFGHSTVPSLNLYMWSTYSHGIRGGLLQGGWRERVGLLMLSDLHTCR